MFVRSARIRSITVHLPDTVETNEDLSAFAPDWQMDKVADKTGIVARRISASEETAADLAFAAAEKMFASDPALRNQIDFLIFCSQTPDYILPTTACILQNKLELRDTTGALDVNLGCSGFVYCVSLAKSLIESGQCQNVLVLTADTYTKLIHPRDRSVRSVFGDGAAATLVVADDGPKTLHPADFGSDGRGAPNLIVPIGGARQPNGDLSVKTDESGNQRSDANLYMNGREILMFTLKRVPASIDRALANAGWTRDNVDLLFLHQASKLVIDTLGQKLGYDRDRVWNGMADIGNTVSSTIPIALRQAADAGRLKPGMKVMTCGFGVGYSWASQAIDWTGVS